MSVPTSAPTKGVISINSTINSYEVGKTILLDVVNPTYTYDFNILTPTYGYSASGGNSSANLIDGNDSTYATQSSNGTWFTIANSYLEIYPSTIRYKIYTGTSQSTAYLRIKGNTALGNEITLKKQNGSSSLDYWAKDVDGETVNVTGTVTYTKWMKNLKSNYDLVYSTGKHYTIESSSGLFRYSTSNIPIYVNINGLGEIRVTGDVLESGKKYELIYNGTNFVAHRKPWEEAV